ncbi:MULTISPECIES: RHS repeat-associated core domain-containing protein [Chryseobacterium]|uniref:RHS repeat-associated core domain-containing protein n=1 Tax=Chryseobacterium TaxID=59732 RepID=UPI0039779996
MGNVRLIYFHNSSSIKALEENNYYPFGLKHDGYNVLNGNPAYNYKYNGKELQETGMYDYGARFYMPDIGRWGVVDPLAEKYTRMSPYIYVGNNPAMFVDYDGRDYGVYVDLKAGTVTVKATYYAVASDMTSLNGAIKTWNESSGKYNYIYKGADGKDISLKVNFELSSSTVTRNENESRYDALNRVLNSDKSGEGNTYKVNNDTDFEKNEKGYTEEGKSITVKKSEADSKKGTGAHEIGHTLNILDGSGVMGSDNSSSINAQHVKEILSAIGGTPQNPTKSTPRPSHSATIHLENNNLKNNEEYKNLRNGKVKSAE